MARSDEAKAKKSYLLGYYYGKRREKQLTQQIYELRDLRMFPRVDYDGMPKGNTHNDLSGYMAKLDDLIRQLEAEREKTIARYKEIHDQIQKLESETEKELLVRRYLLNEEWPAIAFKMHYAESHIYWIHGNALKNLKLPNDDSQ